MDRGTRNRIGVGHYWSAFAHPADLGPGSADAAACCNVTGSAAAPAASTSAASPGRGEGAEDRPRKFNPVRPKYPQIARQAHVQGTRLKAVIAKDGHVENLKLMSGQPLLVSAAMDAVKQWVYKPTYLNGNPVEVDTEIDVNFTLAT